MFSLTLGIMCVTVRPKSGNMFQHGMHVYVYSFVTILQLLVKIEYIRGISGRGYFVVLVLLVDARVSWCV